MRRTLTRRAFLNTSAGLASALGTGCAQRRFRAKQAGSQAVPVILDSDIGDDIDDTWALLMLLKSPRLDLKMVVSDYGNAVYRCRLFAKLLELTGRTDIPVALGLEKGDRRGLQSPWIGDYQLSDYPGTLRRDGITALIDAIKSSPEPVTVLCLGPATNIAEALRRDPSIAANARFVGMQGSIRVGYGGEPVPAVEWNVKLDPQSLRRVFSAPWQCTITPLDTCGLVRLTGDKYQQIYRSEDAWLKALMDNYRVWLPHAPFIAPGTTVETVSTTLFDTVAVYLAMEEDLLTIEELPISVTDAGLTVIDPVAGNPVRCATGWRGLPAFEDRLVEILTS